MWVIKPEWISIFYCVGILLPVSERGWVLHASVTFDITSLILHSAFWVSRADMQWDIMPTYWLSAALWKRPRGWTEAVTRAPRWADFPSPHPGSTSAESSQSETSLSLWTRSSQIINSTARQQMHHSGGSRPSPESLRAALASLLSLLHIL